MSSQITFFDGTERFKIDRKIRLIELFGGIGSQAKALKNLQADFEHYRLCEIDKFAVKSYNAIHGTDFETSDITMLKGNDLGIIGTDKFIYILTYSFPCTDLSTAGLRKGMSKGSDTRSGLLWEVERLLSETSELPHVLLMENVPEVAGKKNIADFIKWRGFLESLGYKSYFNFLNSRNYGIPQNRNRCFMISLLGDYYYEFPEQIPLKLCLKDMLEERVDEKYYLSEKLIKHYEERTIKRNGSFAFKPKIPDGVAATITTKSGSRPTDNYIIEAGNLNNPSWHRPMNVVLSPSGICTTLNTAQGGYREPKILEPDTAYGYKIVWREDFERQPIKNISRTILTNERNNAVIYKGRIRKLTPLECFRLMGFSDEDCFKCLNVGLSNAQAYKQTGNSIVVNVLEAIFKMLF